MPVSTVACGIAGDVDGAHRCTPSVTQWGRSLDQGGESVDIRAASKNYDAVRALDNVTLNVEPRLILMDEPLSALDKQLREAMQIELRELHKRIGATIIYVTHDQREALTMSDRVAILKDGRLVQIDRPERLHDYPADSFVASFIGEASLLPVRRIDSNSVALGSVLLRSARAIPDGDALILAVHSE